MMNEPALADALTRAERALERIERAAAALPADRQRHADLRAKVNHVVGELDDLIRAAGSR